jgi:hypothetical protein
MGERDAKPGRRRRTSIGFRGARVDEETLDLVNLEVTVEPDLLHDYGEIPVVGFQEQIALGELRSGVPQRSS